MGVAAIGGCMAVEGQATEDFAAWVEPHLPAMARSAGRLVPQADRDDLMQDALLRAWRRWSTFDPSRGRPLVWLLAIIADQARRRQGRSVKPSAQLLDVASTTQQEPADVDLERAISRLSARQRTAIDLHYFVDLDIATVAEVMRCAPGTVKATLFQARARLRALAGDDDD